MIILLMGPPGAGKGTQARRITEKYDVIQLATGDMFRERIASGDEFGQKIKDIVESGNLVPDEMTIKMIEERIAQPDCENGFILDGFPRTVEQAEGLKKMLEKHELSLDAVVQIAADDDALVERISGRFTCSDCDEGYHDTFKKPKQENICDCCGAEDKFKRRADDTAEKVKVRLGVYHKQTAPVLTYYEDKNMLEKVDGMQDMDDVTSSIAVILDRIVGHDKPQRKNGSNPKI